MSRHAAPTPAPASARHSVLVPAGLALGGLAAALLGGPAAAAAPAPAALAAAPVAPPPGPPPASTPVPPAVLPTRTATATRETARPEPALDIWPRGLLASAPG